MLRLRRLLRAAIDLAFLRAMLAQASGLRTRAKAWVIYVIVRLFGWASYRGQSYGG